MDHKQEGFIHAIGTSSFSMMAQSLVNRPYGILPKKVIIDVATFGEPR